jgi:hypothetical protein
VSRLCAQGKDVFEAFYKKDFAKRLLMDKSASIDVEKAMIAKLKAECGAQYTSKLEGMFKDEQVSKDMAAAFKASEEYRRRMPAGMDANVRVLTSGFWPSYPLVEATLPEEIMKCASTHLRSYAIYRSLWLVVCIVTYIHISLPSCLLGFNDSLRVLRKLATADTRLFYIILVGEYFVS